MDFQAQLLAWPAAEPASTAIRQVVFQAEQGIPAALDFDGRDPQCQHCVVTMEERPAGVARLDGSHLQRVAVLPQFRGRGVGQLLIQSLVDAAAKQGASEVVAQAQAGSVPIFRRLGFDVADQVTLIGRVPHRHVHLALG